MSPEEAVIERIKDLNTSAGQRVYNLKLPQRPTLPAVRVQLISDPEEYHLRGGLKYGRARVQVDSYAQEDSGVDPYAQASDLADEINGDDAGSGLSGGQWSSNTSPEFLVTGALRLDRRTAYTPDELRLVGISLDFQVHYQEV